MSSEGHPLVLGPKAFIAATPAPAFIDLPPIEDRSRLERLIRDFSIRSAKDAVPFWTFDMLCRILSRDRIIETLTLRGLSAEIIQIYVDKVKPVFNTVQDA